MICNVEIDSSIIHYQCNACKQKFTTDDPIDLPDGMEMVLEKPNNYVFVCRKCSNKEFSLDMFMGHIENH